MARTDEARVQAFVVLVRCGSDDTYATRNALEAVAELAHSPNGDLWKPAVMRAASVRELDHFANLARKVLGNQPE